MSEHHTGSSRSNFRTEIRKRRNQLTSDFQQHAAHELIHQFRQLPEVKISQHIALYLSSDGELDTQPVIHWLWQQGKSVYLPVIHPFSPGHLLFLKYTQNTCMVPNRYGIQEPRLRKADVLPIQYLDLIFTPLVGFDATGQRLGMGGGYYDRTLAEWKKVKPVVRAIGLAHDCQYVDKLPVESWDIPLPKIVTPTKIWSWESS
ncbi:putative 5-formyltetrahydrofolate cyclo-ligase [Vibrio aerogenes CECT 7868]|uniref:5-formyltetrahydrofolate cyclo-ligase n=1 Tax=Vibrio aerogenes CECT 7868 TaxID=1216006 RepID=A0A1M5YK06_9VIBR|nr:5-formyltetrahydrofolate cyclo-ligase [Vibrio aerogenes]SHI11863.1 putative 5-formyltetrahydrofolate cyclo-ligase [Vibrio aerogenes CECT 7868]